MAFVYNPVCATYDMQRWISRKKNTKSHRRYTQLSNQEVTNSMINCTFFDNIYSFYHRIMITLSYVRNVTMIKKVWLTDPLLSRRPIIDIQGERQLPYEYFRFTSEIYVLTSYVWL